MIKLDHWAYPRSKQLNNLYKSLNGRKRAFGHVRCPAKIRISITKTSLFKYILKILPPKKEKKIDTNSDIFHISAQNIDCGYPLEPPRRGGSNEYPQSMIFRRNKINNVYSCKPHF